MMYKWRCPGCGNTINEYEHDVKRGLDMCKCGQNFYWEYIRRPVELDDGVDDGVPQSAVAETFGAVYRNGCNDAYNMGHSAGSKKNTDVAYDYGYADGVAEGEDTLTPIPEPPVHKRQDKDGRLGMFCGRCDTVIYQHEPGADISRWETCPFCGGTLFWIIDGNCAFQPKRRYDQNQVVK